MFFKICPKTHSQFGRRCIWTRSSDNRRPLLPTLTPLTVFSSNPSSSSVSTSSATATPNAPRARVSHPSCHGSLPCFSTAVVFLRLLLWSDQESRTDQQSPCLFSGHLRFPYSFFSTSFHDNLLSQCTSKLHRHNDLFPNMRLATSRHQANCHHCVRTALRTEPLSHNLHTVNSRQSRLHGCLPTTLPHFHGTSPISLCHVACRRQATLYSSCQSSLRTTSSP